MLRCWVISASSPLGERLLLQKCPPKNLETNPCEKPLTAWPGWHLEGASGEHVCLMPVLLLAPVWQHLQMSPLGLRTSPMVLWHP